MVWFLADDKLDIADKFPDYYRMLDGSHIKYHHYINERHTLYILLDFFEKMKAMGIYDNTQIVLVSDHGHYNSLVYQPKKLPYNRHGLLMVKDYNSHGPLAIKPDFMQTSDVPSIVCSKIEGCDGVPGLETITADRVRYHFHNEAFFFPITAVRFPEYYTFFINGTMYDADSWSMPPPK